MRHLVLLGDSVFDNAAYVGGGPDVVTQLRALLPAGDRATLLAVDGSTTVDVVAQLARLPADATDLVLSVGGNDALRHVELLARRARDGAEVLGWLANAVAPFAAAYRALLRELTARGLPVTACTIYDGDLEPALRRPARAAVAIFDDAIQRLARAAGVGVIELRDLCTGPDDYANPIEPSVRGGAKIAAAIHRQLLGAPPSPGPAPDA
ncbi:MAG TPA: SGNH/GDSL hydrolase family protein [Gemmatimonadaceae bacterium]|nr:SGNH/GDSL hydrolase family protein [Gemmatimonadaceae bacterium]